MAQVCAPGSFTPTFGVFTACITCDPGRFSAANASQCLDCSAGTFDHDSNASTQCNSCPIGATSSAVSTTCADINECASDPCLHATACVNGQNNYTCVCRRGWTGGNCSVDVNECASAPCYNGATCLDSANNTARLACFSAC